FLEGELPQGLEIRGLGIHRLKDLQHEEDIFQLTHPDLRSDFAPLRSLTRYRNNLPNQLTSFVGRTWEISEVEKLIPTCRLLTLTGAGGCGKTRLALEVASRVGASYGEGVWLVELASLTNPGLVPTAICSALEVTEEPSQDALSTLIDRLRESS